MTEVINREATHGEFSAYAAVCQSIKDIYHESPNWVRLTNEQREALEMDAGKKARILVGDPNIKDHWADSAGYMMRVAERLI